MKALISSVLAAAALAGCNPWHEPDIQRVKIVKSWTQQDHLAAGWRSEFANTIFEASDGRRYRVLHTLGEVGDEISIDLNGSGVYELGR